jgi:hypothetical protein
MFFFFRHNFIFQIASIFFLFAFCKPQHFSNICDPYGKAFYEMAALKLALGDKSSICGIPAIGGPSTSKEITAYTIPSLGITGVITGSRISVLSDTLSTLSDTYVAQFSTTGKSVTIAGVSQTSGITSNSYSTNLVYTVTAQDGSTQDYTVTMTAPRALGGTSSLVFWLKADSLALSDGDSVQTWNDLSGRGNDITQGTVSARPTYKVNQVNGFPSLRFTQAGATSMNIVTGTGFYVNNSGTLIVVLKVSLGGGFVTIGGANGREFALTTPALNWYAGRNGIGSHYTSAFSIPTTSYIAIGNVQVLSSLNTEYWNGDVKGSIASGHDYSGAASPNNMSFFSNMEADIAEFFYFNTALSQADLDKIFCYLRIKYNLTATTTSCGT